MPELIHLEHDDVALVLDARGEGLPRVLHWGAPLDPLGPGDLAALADAVARQTPPGTLDAAPHPTLAPQEADGWSGRPGVQLRRDGLLVHPRWQLTGIEVGDDRATITAVDEDTGLRLTSRTTLASGVVWLDHELTLGRDATSPIEVDHLEATLPVPTSVDHLTTFDGRWTREKRPVTTAVPAGATVRQSRRGRPGHDAPSIYLLSERSPAWSHGSVWAAHVTWPADVTYRLDRITDQPTLLGGGELLRPGEVALEPGQGYRSPTVAFIYAPDGLDGLAGRLHRWLRARPGHPRTPRPLTLNTWEAVYFDHDPDRLLALAERAADLGIERFVLDDGWFPARRDDTAGLGDWVVDRSVWPEGLGPLADRVHELGMQFGLWFEPEMVSVDSDLYRAHPDWLLHDRRHLAHDEHLSWRNQYVLDLANPEAYAHVLGQMDELVTDLGIDAIKWDHNRDLVESRHRGRPGTHAHTRAALRLMAELKERHPGLEIESCSSGGARTDLGVLAVCDRVWASDSNDPVERQDIQRWTGLLLPPELVGAHVGPATSHSSGRVTPLSYRMATSLMGSAGFECDLSACTSEEATTIAAFAALYRELRPVIHRGRVVHPELRDPAWRVTGYLQGGEAVYIAATVASLEDARAERLRLRGLEPDRRYRVRVREEIGRAEHGWVRPPWFTAAGIELPGSVLTEVGLQLPTLWPCQAFVLHVTPAAA